MIEFQSARPVWGATSPDVLLLQLRAISIPAPRVGRDAGAADRRDAGESFNPRAPCGARRHKFIRRNIDISFNPRAPCGARRREDEDKRLAAQFQSTRPVWGATSLCVLMSGRPICFNPRAPCGARQDLPAVLKPVAAISIYAPHGRGGVSAGRPAGQRFLRPGPSCAYRARFDCRSGTMRRGRTGCRCSWTYPTHPIERNRTHRTAGHTWRSR